MPALFIRIEANFTLTNQEDMDPVVQDFQNLTSTTLSVSIYKKDEPSISFTINSAELESGHLNAIVVGDTVEVEVNAVAKLNVRPQYIEDFLDAETKWECSGIEGVVGDISGLETESYEEYNRFHDKTYTFNRYFIPVKTGKKLKDLG